MQQYFEFVMNNWLLFLALVVIVALLIMTTVRARLLGFNEVKPVAAVQLMNHEAPLILDVRENDEFKAGYIQGAVHIPVGELDGRINELAEWREKPVLIYCRAGQRSATAAAILKRQGFSQLSKLDGGMMAWQSAHLPVSRGA
jgi:rhodanese-related sulfurtransferase